MLPAYLPNPVAALFGGGTPVDRGMNFSDGRRIFGDGKTYRGLVCGDPGRDRDRAAADLAVSEAYGLGSLPEHTWISVTLLATGALLGDLVQELLQAEVREGTG